MCEEEQREAQSKEQRIAWRIAQRVRMARIEDLMKTAWVQALHICDVHLPLESTEEGAEEAIDLHLRRSVSAAVQGLERLYELVRERRKKRQREVKNAPIP